VQIARCFQATPSGIRILRPASVDVRKPAICRQGKTGNFLRPAETSNFYFVASSVRKSVWTLGTPAPWPAFKHVRMMQQPIEQRGDGRRQIKLGFRGAKRGRNH
jgi:hypothetical protein